MTILDRASAILYERSEEKERQYGPFDQSMEMTVKLANDMGSNLTLKDVYIVLIALKLARESYAHKEDNILDAIVYMAQMNDHLNKQNNNNWKVTGVLNTILPNEAKK